MPDNNKKNTVDLNRDKVNNTDFVYHPTYNNIKEGTLEEFGKTGAIDASFGNTDFGESKFDTSNTFSEDILSGEYKDLRGEKQSRTDKLFNAVPRLLGKVGTEIAKTPGYLYALGEAGLTDKTLAESLDNAWLNGLEQADQSVKDQFAIYTPKSVKEGNLWDNFTSTSFWTDEGVDGAGFLISMMAPGAALKATGIAGKLAKLPMLSKLGAANIELGQATLLNTALESAAETKGVVDDLTRQFQEEIVGHKINPNTGNFWTEEEAKEAIGEAGVSTFQMNMGLLLVPNMIMNKNLLGRFSGSKRVLDEFRDATGKFVTTNPIVKKSLIKEYAKSIGTSIGSEGFMEEAGQTTIENYNKKVATGDNTADLASEYINTLTTVEGQKAILLGAVMGGLGSIKGTHSELKGEAKQRATLSNLIKNNFEGFSVAMDNIIQRDSDGNIEFHEGTTTPKINKKVAADVITNLVKEQQSTNLQDLAALTNDKDIYDYIFNQQLTRFALPYLNVEGGSEVLEQHIDDLSKNIVNANTSKLEDTQFKTELKSQIKDLGKINESLQESVYSLPLEQLSQDTKIVGAFANKLFNTAYQESSKQLFLTKKIEQLNRDLLTLHAEAAQVSQFTIEREKIINRIESLNKSLQISKENYNSVFNADQIKKAFNDFAGTTKVEQETITKAEEKEAAKPVEKPKVKTTAPPKYSSSKDDLDADNAPPRPEDMESFESKFTKPEVEETGAPVSKADEIELRRQEELNSSEKRYNITKEGNLNNNSKIRKFYVWESKDNSSTVAPDNIALTDEKALTEWHESKGHIKVWKEEKVQSDKDFEKSNKENELDYLDRNKQINAKYDAELAALTEGKITNTNTPKENINIVSQSLISENADTTYGDEQVTEVPTEKQKVAYYGGIKGVASIANAVMMKVFHNYFTEEGAFRFERTNEGLPEINEQSEIDIDELNSIKEGDELEFKIVTLTGKALIDYEQSKTDSINAINYHITQEGNEFNYPTNDKNYGFNDKPIGIYSNGKLVGFVQEPHAITVKNNGVNPETGTQLYTDARNAIIRERDAILRGLENGKVTTTVKEKGAGNLYTKLKSDGRIDPVNRIFDNPRDTDKTPSENLVFVYNDGKSLQLPKMDDSEMEDDIKQRLSELGNWGKPGSVFQLVKDTSGKWYPIPVYANTVDDVTFKGIKDALKTLTNKSTDSDVLNALNPFIYVEYDTEKTNAGITLDTKGGNTLIVDGVRHTIDNLNKGIGLADFKDGLLTKRQNIQVLDINTQYTQKQLLKRNTIASNALTYKGEYLVQPFVSYVPITESIEVIEYKQAEAKLLAKEVNNQSTVTIKDPLKDIESTSEALFELNTEEYSSIINLKKSEIEINKWIAENPDVDGYVHNQALDAIRKKYPKEWSVDIDGDVRDISLGWIYHKAKADGSNPELVQAVEKLLSNTTSTDLKAKPDAILNSPNDKESLLDKMLREQGPTNDPGFSRTKVGNTTLNRKDAKAWLKAKLPGLTLSDLDELSSLRTNITDAIGAYRNMVVYLFKGASNKTVYHEAFHGVFRNMLSNEEKFAVIEEAITKYKAPSEGDLMHLQEGLSFKATPEQLTYLYYEEKLADDFADFIENEGTKSTWTKIKDFFNRILKQFNIFTTNNSDNINTLFNDINTGSYKTKSKVAKNANIQLVNRELKGEEFGPIGFARHQDFTATFKWDRTRSIGDTFMVKYQTLVRQGVKDIKPAVLYTEIYNEYKKLENDATALGKMTPVELANLKKVLNNFTFLTQEVDKYLETYNIKSKSDGTLDYSEQLVESVEDVEVQTLEAKTTKGLSEQVTQAGLKSASVRVKMFLSGIEVIDNGIVKKDVYGFTMYHPFTPLYYYLERQLTGIDDFQEMISEMKTLSALRPELLTVIDKLTKTSTHIDEKELTKLQNDFKSNFSKQQLSYSLVKFDTDSNTGEVTYRVFDANRMSINIETADTWKDNLINPNRKTIAIHVDDSVVVNGLAEAQKMKEQLPELAKLIITKKAKYKPVNAFLTKLGIEFSPEVLQKLLDNGSSSLVLNVNTLLDFHRNPDPDAATIEAYDKAMKELVKLETSGKLQSYTQSFNNVENSNIYTIQLPSYASKLMADLTGKVGKFNSRLEDLRKDPLYTYSNILNDLEKSSNYRTNQFRLSYLDGLKDEKGSSDGSKFTNMSPKDFMSMQIALFQNLSVNRNKKGKTGKVNKYVYITPSDKSMAMIYDATSYNASLTDGELTIDTPIVNNFYNVFLQEAARIKQQLEIKAKVESGELSSDNLLTHYHYKPKSKPTDFDGFAYEFMHFGNEVDEKGRHTSNSFNGKFLSKVTELLQNGTEDVQESLVELEAEVKNEILQQLRKEFHASLNEAVEKGVISKVDKNTYKSISLDAKGSNDVKQVIADFSLNSWLNNIEMSNLLNGDIALYKAKDLQKRTYQSGAMGVSINTTEHPIIKTKVVKDFTSKSDLEHLREFAGDVIDSYDKNNVTDAQVLVSPKFYKDIFVGRGTWTDAMQVAYDIAEGNIKNPTPEQLKDARLQLSNIKPFYYGSRFDEKLGIQRFEQVKCAMLPLFKSYIKDNPLMAEKRAEMDAGLDMIAFESAFKAAIGSRESVDSEGGLILDLDMKNFMIQVDNPAHILDEENDSIRQIKMLMLGNIDPDMSYSGKSGKDIIKEINDIEGFNINESLKDLTNLIKYDKTGKFKSYLKEMLTKRNATENMLEALNIVDGEFEYALDGGPTSVAMENLISSLFTNKVIKQSFDGGSGVQASALGHRYEGGNPTLDKMQSDLKYMVEEDGTIWSEAIMPAWSKEFFNEDGTHKDNIPDNLKQLLFYRIPTEGFHSMMAIKVKSFLPVEYGNTILMPYEVTAQFGADFDFDKVYFLSPHFKTNEDGTLEKVAYDNFKPLSENSKEARNNKILDNYLKVLSSKEILPLIMSPSGFKHLEDIKKQIDEDDNIQYSSRSFFSSVTQRDYKQRNHVGIGLKGQLALHVSGHSYATLLNLSLIKSIPGTGVTAQTDISFNGTRETNLSKLYNFEGKLISKEVSALMAAILDDIKNPIIQALGVNEFTADVWATIVRAGFSSKTAINFLTQPAIVELSSKLAENNYKIKSKDSKRNSVDTLLEDYQTRLKSVFSTLTEAQQADIEKIDITDNNISDEDMEFYRHWKSVNVNKLNPNEGRTAEAKEQHNIELAKYYKFQLQVLSSYSSYDIIAKDLVKINRLFGVNKEIGPNFEDIVNKKYLMDEIEDKGFSISGLDRSTLGRIKPLESAYKAHLATLEYLSKYFPYDSDAYREVKFNLIDNLHKKNGKAESLSKLPVKTRMLINGFLRNYIDYKSSTFLALNSKEVKEKLFTKTPKLLDDIKNIDNDANFFNGALRKNVFIENLKSNFDEKSGLSFISLKTGKLDTQIKNNISESIFSLYKNEATKPIVLDLIKHAFAASGFHRGLRTYYDLIPPAILKELGYSTYRKDVTSALNRSKFEITSSESDRIIDQLVRNFPSELTKTFDSFMFKPSGKNLTITFPQAVNSGRVKELVINYNDVISKEEPPIFVTYMRVYDNKAKKSILYKYDKGVYKPISKLGKAGSMIEVDTTEDIENSLVKENNLDNKSILTTFANETSTDESIERPLYDSDEFIGEPESFEDSFLNVQPMTDPETTLRLEAERSKPDLKDLENEDWTSDTNECGI